MWPDYFDKIFLINLPARPDRLRASARELAQYGIPYEVIPAIKRADGREGLYLTMCNLFHQVLATAAKRILVFEDDHYFRCDPSPVMDKCIEQLPEDFDLFYMGCNLAQQPTRFYSDNLLTVTRALSSHAVAYSRACIQRILSFPAILPIDLFYVHNIQSMGKSFCSCPMMVSQCPGFSDIEKRETDWTAVLDKRFEEHISMLLNSRQYENSQCCRA